MMEKYCKNCGAKLNPSERHCPDCGREIKLDNITCPDCGEINQIDSRFCRNCGRFLQPDFTTTTKSINKKNNNKLFIGLAIGIVVIVLIFGLAFLTTDIGSQTVTVGGEDFLIPEDFEADSSMSNFEADEYGASHSQGWVSGDEGIGIGVISSNAEMDVDLDSILSSLGGEKTEMFGFDGYLQEDDGVYSFSFEYHGKVCMITVTDEYLFDEIEVL